MVPLCPSVRLSVCMSTLRPSNRFEANLKRSFFRTRRQSFFLNPKYVHLAWFRESQVPLATLLQPPSFSYSFAYQLLIAACVLCCHLHSERSLQKYMTRTSHMIF